MTVDDRSFAQFEKLNPDKAALHVAAVREVTGVAADDEIRRALDKTKDVNGEFNIVRAVDLLLDSPVAPPPPLLGPVMPPAVVLTPPTTTAAGSGRLGRYLQTKGTAQ